MLIKVLLDVEVDEKSYAKRIGVLIDEVPENLASEFLHMSDALTWSVASAEYRKRIEYPSDVVRTIQSRPQNGVGGGIPLTRGEVAMLFLDGHAGDFPGLLDIRSQGYGADNDWRGLTTEDVLEDEDTAFVWTKWEPIELWCRQTDEPLS